MRHTPHHLSGIHGRFALALTTLIVSAFGQQAGAKAIVASAHTTTLAANCWITGPGRVEDSPIRVCRGKATLVVLVNQGAQRETVSVGHNRIEAAKEPAAHSSFGPFNRALPGIEWRIAGGNPIAIIQRWRIADSDAKPMLVVTRLPPGRSAPSPMWTRLQTPTRTNWRARPPTRSRAISNAAPTTRRCSAQPAARPS